MWIHILTFLIMMFDTFCLWEIARRIDDEDPSLDIDILQNEISEKVSIFVMYLYGICMILSIFFLKAVLCFLVILYILFSIGAFKFPIVLRLVAFSIFFCLV